MTHRFFASELEGVATFWRIERRDGVAIGLTNHDRDLWFDALRHQASPGMVPSAIRRTRDLTPDSAEVSGALCATGLCGDDLAAGRFDGASFAIGLVDWETLERTVLFRGQLGEVAQAKGTFQVELLSAKTLLEIDPVPRTSPTCRAEFCGPGCNLSAARFTHEARIVSCDAEAGRIGLWSATERFAGGWLRWVDGPHAGETMPVAEVEDSAVLLDHPGLAAVPPGTAVILREGCDRTIATCHGRFANALNFRGEPFLPGNDLVTRHAGMMR